MKLYSLNDLFTRFRFVTPDYQRGYAWKNEHVEAFLEDLKRIGLANPQHFASTLILEHAGGKDVPHDALVVDGQQRLTTAVLLFAAIAEALDDRQHPEAEAFRKTYLGDKDFPAFRYGPANDSWPFLTVALFKDRSAIPRAADHRSAYTKNIESALSFLKSSVKALTDVKLDALRGNLCHRFVFNLVEVDPNLFNIHVAFESINNRGKSLTKLELLKNRLIYLASILKSPQGADEIAWSVAKENLRSEINAVWSGVYSWLGRGDAAQDYDALDEEEFLRVHSTMYFDADTNEKEWLGELLFKKTFTGDLAIGGDLTMDAIKLYLNSLGTSVVLWSHIKRPRKMPAKQELWLKRILHVHRPLFDPLILAAYVRLVGDDTALTLDLRKTQGLDAMLIQLLKEIERFNVLVFLVTGKRSHTSRSDFAHIAHDLYAKKSFYDSDTATSLGHLSALVRSYVYNIDPDDEEKYVLPGSSWRGFLDLEAFQNQITRALRHDQGYYGHDWTRVLLFEYEEHLRASDNGAEKVQWDRVSADSIEHIYPQSDEHWKDLTASIDARKRGRVNSYRHSLGNLVLLNRSKNSQLQNYPYMSSDSTKAKRPRFEQGSYSETHLAAEYPRKWSKTSIETRGTDLLKFAEQRWDFSFKCFGIKYRSILVIE